MPKQGTILILFIFAASVVLVAGGSVGAQTQPVSEKDASDPAASDDAATDALSEASIDPESKSAGGAEGMKHAAFVLMLIEYEPDLQAASHALAEVLTIRLGKYGVEVYERAMTDKSPVGNTVWLVTLRRISERHLIVTIDSADERLSLSEVRTVSWQPEIEQLAWTMALVVEETVTPYLENQGELPALGAGLAILEPQEVAGTKKRNAIDRPSYPRFYAVGAGLSLAAIWNISEIISGPRFFLKGMFSRRTVALFSMGWLGSASYGRYSITGSLSQIPIELYVGNIFFHQQVFKLVGWVGFSLGFAVYKSDHVDAPGRKDLTFQPGGNFLLEATVRIVSPLGFFLQGGCSVPFVRDVLVNNNVEIYTQVWVMPVINLGFQLAF
ncbi:MAG: hypothetical protein JXX14_23155 [Deltaproteobacteria bacterium]|nr:hypothetical protein [Deltaproteobacteria bacterium]